MTTNKMMVYEADVWLRDFLMVRVPERLVDAIGDIADVVAAQSRWLGVKCLVVEVPMDDKDSDEVAA